MKEPPHAVAVIHARGGSRRIPLKNLRELDGRPLLAYPIELCRKTAWIDRVVVSTDHDEIMETAVRYGAEVPFRRPADIADDVPSELVTEHALRHLLEADGRLPELCVTLTPATPLTRPPTLQQAYELFLIHPEWDAVTAIRRASEHPEWMLILDQPSGEVRTLLGNPLDGDYNVSQNLQPVHYPTGAFWINRCQRFLEQPSLYGERWGAVELGSHETVDIDTPDDLLRAQSLVGTQRSETAMSAASSWDGMVNFSAYDDVEVLVNYSTQSELEAYRRERLGRYEPYVEFFRSLGSPTGRLRVVDVGAGSSAFLYALEQADLLDRGVAIELSSARHHFAERWREDAGYRHVSNTLGDVGTTSLESGAFDRVAVLDDTYLYLRPEDERYPERLFELALRALVPGGLLVIAFRNDVPSVAAMPDQGRSFWVQLPKSNAFRYALYQQLPNPDRSRLRNESTYIASDGREARKTEITEVCDVADLVAQIERSGFEAVVSHDGLSQAPFDPGRSRVAVIVAKK